MKNIKYKNNYICETIKVTFKRKNKIYTKDIFLLITNEMKINIKNPNIKQSFMDCTYYAIPQNNHNFKLLIILGFDTVEYKTKLLLISIIKNENIEMFMTILKYLRDNLYYNPKIMTCDCNNAEIISIKRIFPDCQIILYFFHIIKNCVHKLPELKSKVKTKKLRAKNLLANIKLLLFVNANNIETMFKKIIF